jgi:DNA-binding transcriptional LysR family regulator
VSKALAALEDALGLQMAHRDRSELVLNLPYQAEAFLALEWQDATITCLILAEELSSAAARRTLLTRGAAAVDFGVRLLPRLVRNVLC